ncbi:hypothetical protein EH240_35425 [Mesorhizobium tamadayense]|uniref:Uncharacterized protein n=1 Tax=Mesorhizobium tamadayense TaxID=425306 RepID=A0A3P3ER34_9HYPH|nr:hypothetical protein [Mesorhizobium tamadayense]RRH88262.1 hypothetical protein EH240_35425 [Mesorhizobium tamadayense]
MNRERRNPFGRRLSGARPALAQPIADQSLSAEVTEQEKPEDRVEALGFIICRLDELRQMAASHGLESLGYLLDVAFTESCEAIRRERSSAQSEAIDASVCSNDVADPADGRPTFRSETGSRPPMSTSGQTKGATLLDRQVGATLPQPGYEDLED